MELKIIGKLQTGPILVQYGLQAYLISLVDRSCTKISKKQHQSYYNSGVFMLTVPDDLREARKIWEEERPYTAQSQ